MRLARVEGLAGRHVASRDFRGQPAFCPVCDGALLPKCGSIRIHHWAHRVAECDPWWEPETEWHRRWKERFPEVYQEVTVGPHRADVKTDRLVIELQHSPISPEVIRAREEFYGEMIWIFDMQDQVSITLDQRPGPGSSGGWLFWSPERRSILTCRKPVFLDFGNGLVANLYDYGSHRHSELGLCFKFGYYDSFTCEDIAAGATAPTGPGLVSHPFITSDFDSRPWPARVLDSPAMAAAARRHADEERRRELELRFHARQDWVDLPVKRKEAPSVVIMGGGRATLPPEALTPVLNLAREAIATALGLQLIVAPIALFVFATEPEGTAEEEDATVVYTVGLQEVSRAKRSELDSTTLSGRGVLFPSKSGVILRISTSSGFTFDRLFTVPVE